MKTVFFLLFTVAWLFSCHQTASRQSDSPLHKKLVPYAQQYPGTGVRDTLLAGNIYLKYMVRGDTADGMLYICYGGPGFDSIHTQKDGAPFSCNSWEYAYHTPQTIGLMYECISGRELLVLPLDASGHAQVYTPLFMGMEDSLLLVEGHRKSMEEHPALIAADLDFKQQKSFQLSFDIPCDDLLACFDTIYFNKKLVMQYESGKEGDEPVTRTQVEGLSWKK